MALRAMADRHGWEHDAIAAVMALETGRTFSPAIRNPKSGAVGLIQFMPATARSLGTTSEALAQMSAVEQLEFVELYLQRALKNHSHLRPVDYYLAVFYPAAIGAPLDAGFIARGSAAYEANRTAFDPEGKGYITPQDLADRMAHVMAQGPLHAKKKAVEQAGS